MRLRATSGCLLILVCAAAASADEDPVGTYVGGGIGGVVQGNAVGEVFVGRWWENFGVEAGLSVFKSEIDLEPDGAGEDDVKIEDALGITVGVKGKAGVPLGRAKPYVGLGLRYQRAESNGEQIDLDRDFIYIIPSLGVDIRAAEHIVLGIVIVSAPVIVHGKLNEDRGSNFADFDGDFEGFSVELLSSFSVSFLF